MPPILTGPNVTSLRHHFQNVDGLSVPDIDQIVVDGAAVFAQCLPAGTAGTTKGLIYGNIQSGKTAVILALLAVAADNGYRRFVVLTSDLNDLYVQTLDRTKNALHGLTVLGKAELADVAAAQTPSPCVLVLSKNVRVLQRARAIVTSPGWSGSSVLMVDDEADQASLDTTVNRPGAGPSGVNREIGALRGAVTSLAFVQTTATPQALLLQDANAPFRPDFVRVTTPGTGYCGGDTFFVNENFANPRYLRFVPLLDVATLRTNQVLPPTLEEAVYQFLVGAAVLRVQGSVKNYQALIHTALTRDEHEFVRDLVDVLTRRITATVVLASTGAPVPPADQAIIQGLQAAYADIAAALPVPAPPFANILNDLTAAMPSTSVMEINSRTGQGVLATPNRRHVIYVGGAKLGRGVTLKNLLVTYYARDAQSPQIDTVLQHARMYGYRQNELPCTRIYLPPHLAVRFREIHKSDNAMREVAAANGTAIPVIPIPIRSLRATRRNVLSDQTVEMTTYVGGRQYYPLVPESGASIAAQTAALDAALAAMCPVDRQIYNTTITDLLVLLNNVYGTPGSPGAWDDELVRNAVGLLENIPSYANQAQIIVGNRSSNVAKLATRGVVPQIQALLPAGVGNPPYGARADVPVLVFMRLNGNTAQNWDGVPFWVPNIRFPDGNYAFSLNRT